MSYTEFCTDFLFKFYDAGNPTDEHPSRYCLVYVGLSERPFDIWNAVVRVLPYTVEIFIPRFINGKFARNMNLCNENILYILPNEIACLHYLREVDKIDTFYLSENNLVI
jgi:hypothetical protein